MGDGEVLLTTREADRVAVIREVVESRLRQSEAARRLGLSERQVKRLARRYRERGAAGLASGRRGRRSNNTFDEAFREAVMKLVRKRYRDFGPTFASQKLLEEHGHRLSAETLRGWMIEDGLWRSKARREVREHPSRPRRECVGDLVQIDGSPHDWFEGRGPSCTLIVYVDDATSRLLATGFFPSETTEAYMRTTRAHFGSHGRPVAYYSDRHGVFRVNRRGREGEPTQFVRALRTLDVESIHPGSPQAKGRVERANLTLQDRLVKEMRLRGIGGIEAGNAYLPAFMADYNRRFGVAPRNPSDAHRAVLHDERELDLILCGQHVRKVTRNLSISFEGDTYQVTGRGRGYRLRGAAVTVCKGFDGTVTVLRDGRELPVRLLGEGEAPLPVEDEKSVRLRVDRAKAEQQSRPARKPAPDHPWRRAFKPEPTGTAAGGTAEDPARETSSKRRHGPSTAVPEPPRPWVPEPLPKRGHF